MKKIIAFFNNERDAQQAFNSITEAGFDTDNISLVLSDKNKGENLDPAEQHAEEQFDENEEFEQTQGVLWPIEAQDLDTEALSVPGIGAVIVAGPILERISLEDLDNLEEKFDSALTELGIPTQELTAFKTRINARQILAVMVVEDENYDEIAAIFSDAGSDLMDFDMQLN